MSRKPKVAAEEKVRIVEAYLMGRISWTEAYETVGVHKTTLRYWITRYKTEGAAGLLTPKRSRYYTKETKHSAVIELLSGKTSIQEICIKYKIKSESQLRAWVKAYNSHGEIRIFTGGSNMTKKRETTLEERIEIARECINKSNNYGEIALKYQVSYSQVYGWVNKYRAMGEAGLEDRRGRRAGTLPSRTPEEELRDRVAQLEREKLDLEMENELLKKVKEWERRRR